MAVSDYQSIINQASATYGVPASLISAVIQKESSGNPSLTSSAGAQGLMQLMPGTAAQFGVTNPFDPTQNIDAGTAYLAQLINQYGGDTATALMAYNWGPGNIASGATIPSSVQNYATTVLNNAGMSTATVNAGGDGSPLIDISGDAAATPTADILTQLENAASNVGIDLTDPLTDVVIAGVVGAVAYLAFMA